MSEPPRGDGAPDEGATASPSDRIPGERRETVRRAVRRVTLALVWLAVAALVSLGGAGVVAGVGPTPESRPELTWRGDQAIEPGLDASTGDLRSLATQVEGLGTTARGAITALIATDRSTLSNDVDQGTAQLDAIEALTASMRRRLMGLPGIDPSAAGGLTPASALTLGPPTRDRFMSLLAALDATSGLAVDWARFTEVSLAAEGLTGLLLDHDTTTAKAASQGRSGQYAAALATLDASDAIVARARTLRDQLAPTTDVSTLTSWLDRNAGYDKALRTLYAALRASNGIVTPAVRTAFAGEQAARQALPPDTRGLVVILGDVARGGLNQAAIEIETARGRLDAALAALQPAAASPGE
ncbi:MAG TPA: hypothetical protein VEY67_09495 [Candidatus Dormibacteraeota bacterium]|nr:hypothetical protein [Candidatus Dormibacteraeota bacterium]